jgi:hypothetical protein
MSEKNELNKWICDACAIAEGGEGSPCILTSPMLNANTELVCPVSGETCEFDVLEDSKPAKATKPLVSSEIIEVEYLGRIMTVDEFVQTVSNEKSRVFHCDTCQGFEPVRFHNGDICCETCHTIVASYKDISTSK